MLKAYGNAIVPEVAKEFIRVEMGRKRIAGELGMLCKVEVICP